MPATFILASESEIRKRILLDAGFKFDTHKPLVDEDKLKSQYRSLAPIDLSVMLAKEKALSVSKIFPDRYVIGGDQICLLGSETVSYTHLTLPTKRNV